MPSLSPTAEYGDTSVNSTIIGPFDTKNRAYCFNVTASPDSYFDGNKTFKYLLTLASDPQPLVVISPNTTEVTIMDNNSKGKRGSHYFVSINQTFDPSTHNWI